MAVTRTHTEPKEPFYCDNAVRMRGMSRGKHHFARAATPALLSHSLVDSVGDQHAASSLRWTECLPSKQARGSDAGECREAARACLHKHSSRACSWRHLSIQLSIRRDTVHPALSEHVCSDISATRGSFLTGQSQSHTP